MPLPRYHIRTLLIGVAVASLYMAVFRRSYAAAFCAVLFTMPPLVWTVRSASQTKRTRSPDDAVIVVGKFIMFLGFWTIALLTTLFALAHMLRP